MSFFSSPIWFSASSAIPPVKAPSPIIGMIYSFDPLISRAAAIPIAPESEVELWPVSHTSCSLSLRFGKPQSPLYWRKVSNSLPRPVNSL